MEETNSFFKTFPALKSRNYQLYFSGQLISLIGSWLQSVAQGWLVFEITQSAFWVGFVSTVSFLPVLIFSLFGGVIVDRFPKKKIILLTQTALMLLALILGILTIFKIINIYEIIIISFLFGIVLAIDLPARQAFVVEMVGFDKLSSAIALNSGTYNGARIIGPAIASTLIAFLGTGMAFILNGASFIAVIIALFFVKVKEVVVDSDTHPLTAIKRGIAYSINNQVVKILLIHTAVLSIFGWSFTVILPVISQNIFQRGVVGLGHLYIFFGVGAVLGTIIVSAFSKKLSTRMMILGGSSLLISSLFLFSLTSNFKLALFFMFISGFGLVLQVSTMNSIIQHLVENHFRGRVMSIYTLMFVGMSTIGSFQIGFLAEHLGSQMAIILNVIILIIALIFLVRQNEIWSIIKQKLG